MPDTNQSPSAPMMPSTPRPQKSRAPLVVILSIVGVLVVGAGIVLAVWLLRPASETAESSTFQTIEGITAFPSFSSQPAPPTGWQADNQLTVESTTYRSVVFKKNNVCTFSASIQSQPQTRNNNDYDLSKAFAETKATTEQGTLTEESTLKVRSSEGEIDFVLGTYRPKLQFDPLVAGGVRMYNDEQTTLIVTRTFSGSIANTTDLPVGASEADRIPHNTAHDDSQYKEGEILTQQASIPTISFVYNCPTAQFNEDEAVELIGEFVIDFTTAKK